MSGERDIPVFYETGAASDVSNVKPFKFDGADFYTKEDLAAAFAAREEPWETPFDHLRFVRRWLESNLEFDEATDIGRVVSRVDSETALFRFVYSNARIPFGVWGHVVNMDNLYAFLWRVSREEASEAERRIIQMLGDGKLAAFYGEYAVWCEPDPVFDDLLNFLQGKLPAKQLDYVSAMREPEAYIWPGDADTSSASGRLECMRYIGSPPLKLETAEDIKNRYALPDELWAAFETRDTYASGTDRLRRWDAEDLLVPKGLDFPAYGHMSIEGYERVAKVRIWGHTADTVRQLNTLDESISSLQTERPAPAFVNAVKKLRLLRDRKISTRDRNFIYAASVLLSKRQAMRDSKRSKQVMFGIYETSLLAAIRVAVGLAVDWSRAVWPFFGFAVLVFFIFHLFGTLGYLRNIVDDFEDTIDYFWRKKSSGTPSFPICILAYLMIVMVFFPMTEFFARAEVNVLGYIFPLIGMPSGALISNTLYNRKMKRNMTEIADVCAAYCSAPDAADS
jgi:hypothetical protein